MASPPLRLWLALGALAVASLTPSPASAQTSTPITILMIDGDDALASTLRQIVIDRLDANPGLEHVDSALSLNGARIMFCEDPDRVCIEAISEHLPSPSFIAGEILNKEGRIIASLTWYEAGQASPVATVEAHYNNVEAFGQGVGLLADDLIAQTALPQAQPPAISSRETAGAQSAALGLRLTPKFGAVAPSADLDAALTVAFELSITLPLETLLADTRDDHLRIALEGGYQLLSQKDLAIVPGRGLTTLIQNSHAFPLNLMALYSAPEGWPIQPYGGLGLSMLVSRSDFEAFSRTEAQNDFSLGALLIAGAQLPLPISETLSGHFVLELQHREVRADLGEIGKVGESALGATSLSAGFGLDL